jgi:hypothetical protein
MEKKKKFIFDLDETIISAEPTEEYNSEKYKTKSSKFRYEHMEGYYIIFERPHLQEFLDFIFENFDVSIWTAATKDYALFIINKIILIKPNRKLDYIFFSYHCNISKKLKKGTKDLSMLWDIYKIKGYNEKNTFILDDYDEVYKTQNCNCIIAEQFKFVNENSEKDVFLKKLKRKIKKYLLTDNDVQNSIQKINSKK